MKYIHPIFMGGNRGHGMFQFFQPRHWPCLCMVLTLVIHRQLTSLTENFDCLVQDCTKFYRPIRAKPLINRVFPVINPYNEKERFEEKRPR